MNTQIIYTIVLFLHNIATAIWVGGMLALLFAILPSVKSSLGKGKETKQLIATIKNKLSIVVYIAFILLFITGAIMGKLTGTETDAAYDMILKIKHGLFFVVIVVGITRSRVIDNLKNLTPQSKEKWNMILLLINITIACIILYLSAYLAALTKIPVA